MKVLALVVFLVGLSLVASEAEPGSPGAKKTCECGWRNPSKARIVNGEDARDGEWPAMVGVQERMGPHRHKQCGGTIVTKRHVLLAAHCVKKMRGNAGEFDLSNPDNITVYFDVINQRNAPESKTRGVEKVHAHPGFQGGGVGNDIALLLIKGEFPFDGRRVGPACYGMRRVPDGVPVITMGWGFTDWESSVRAHDLKFMETITHDPTHCNRKCRGRSFDTENKQQVCVYTEEKATRKGDSGGPLLWYNKNLNRYVLVGITSFGIPERMNCKGVGGFTDPSYFRPWVFEHIKNDGVEVPCHAV